MSTPDRETTISRLGQCRFDTPLPARRFVSDTERVQTPTRCFERAGPRNQLFFDPATTKAGVVTCGGLCPGINDVIKALVSTLRLDYGIQEVLGFRYGYRGLAHPDQYPPRSLEASTLFAVHDQGGTILGSSRGPQTSKAMVDTLERLGINLIFCIGGDGTLRGAHALDKEAKQRGLALSVVGIPKTIDNDLSYVGRSFGFETAVYKTTDIIRTAYWEAKGAYRGIGLVRLMGRDSGFISAYASLATPFVDFCFIPESPLHLQGPQGLFAGLTRRFERDPWAVVVVAEGAGQNLFEGDAGQDASGNQKKHNIGEYLKAKISKHFAAQGDPVKIRYIDPSYLIRGIPAHGTDAIYCAQLAEHAAHAAMAGRTDMVVGSHARSFTHVPLALATAERQKVDLQSDLWQAVLGATRQLEYLEDRAG